MYKQLAKQHGLEKRIEETSIALTNVISVSETKGELAVSQKVYGLFADMDYYKKNPADLYLQDIPTDTLGRKNAVAILRGGKGNPKKAISLLGHTDTVVFSDYGTLIDWCSKPYELTEKINEIGHELPADVCE